MSETTAEAILRLEGSPNTAPRSVACELAGKHRCGGAVTLNWGRLLCAAGGLTFSDLDHRGVPARLEAWMRSKGWAP